MARLKNPGPGPVTLASGRPLGVGESLTIKGELDPEDQANADAGRLVLTDTTRKPKTEES